MLNTVPIDEPLGDDTTRTIGFAHRFARFCKKLLRVDWSEQTECRFLDGNRPNILILHYPRTYANITFAAFQTMQAVCSISRQLLGQLRDRVRAAPAMLDTNPAHDLPRLRVGLVC
jgi:hypothetical protein